MLASSIKDILGPIKHLAQFGIYRARLTLRLTDSPEKLLHDAQSYWRNENAERSRSNAHWRGAGPFADDTRWLAVGSESLKLFQQFSRALDWPMPKRVIEWGCGGGCNAVHFAPLVEEFTGVDIAQASLDECARQVGALGLKNFLPILIDASAPAEVLVRVAEPYDLFLCTYVFELLPSPEYALQIIRVAHQLLRPEGMALIQIKYSTGTWSTETRRWNYTKDIANMTAFRIDEFWTAARDCGFEPKLVSLIPEQPLVADGRYAYFCLIRRSQSEESAKFES